jgi:hypothetical protein
VALFTVCGEFRPEDARGGAKFCVTHETSDAKASFSQVLITLYTKLKRVTELVGLVRLPVYHGTLGTLASLSIDSVSLKRPSVLRAIKVGCFCGGLSLGVYGSDARVIQYLSGPFKLMQKTESLAQSLCSPLAEVGKVLFGIPTKNDMVIKTYKRSLVYLVSFTVFTCGSIAKEAASQCQLIFNTVCIPSLSPWGVSRGKYTTAATASTDVE